MKAKNVFEVDSRTKYNAANQSSIFSTPAQENTKDLYEKMRREKYGVTFEPKFKETVTSTRRSLHNGVEVEETKSKRTSSTLGFRKVPTIKIENLDNRPSIGNAWERKLLDLNPKLDEEDIKKVSNLQDTKGFYAKRSLMSSDVVSSHKDAKVKELQSNIFNDIVR